MDCDNLAIRTAIEKKVNLIITHHPLLWLGRRKAFKSTSVKNKIEKLTKAKIAVYSMHTNYDEMYLKQDSLRLILPDATQNNEESFLSIGKCTKKITFLNLLNKIKNKFSLKSCSYYGNLNHNIKTIAVSPGAGGFVLQTVKEKKIDVLITGEMKWNNWLKARELNQKVVTIGHQMEEIFTKKMTIYLNNILKKRKKTIAIETLFHGPVAKNYSW